MTRVRVYECLLCGWRSVWWPYMSDKNNDALADVGAHFRERHPETAPWGSRSVAGVYPSQVRLIFIEKPAVAKEAEAK